MTNKIVNVTFALALPDGDTPQAEAARVRARDLVRRVKALTEEERYAGLVLFSPTSDID